MAKYCFSVPQTNLLKVRKSPKYFVPKGTLGVQFKMEVYEYEALNLHF